MGWGGAERVGVVDVMSGGEDGMKLAHAFACLTCMPPHHADVSMGLRRGSNLGCYKNSGLYFNPRNDSVVIHYVKKPLGMMYLWEVLHDGLPHNPRTCKRVAGVS